MNCITYKQYTRKRNPERKFSRKSQAQVLVMYIVHFSQMEYIDVTGDIDASYTSLDRVYTLPVQRERKPSRFPEVDVKIELQRLLAASLKLQDNVNAKSESFKCITLSGKVVADSLLQYDPKEQKIK